MLDRLKTTVAVLSVGLAALMWGLGNLQVIFMEERDEALAALWWAEGQDELRDLGRVEEEAAKIAKRYRIKSSFVLSCGMLGLIIAGLAILAQWRKARLAELKSDFVATVSHELKTPLASIRLLAETMEQGEKDGQAYPGYPGKIVEVIDSLNFLVENILSFNRLGKDGWRLRKSDVWLVEVVEWAAEEAQSAAAGEIVVEAHGLEDAKITADPDLVRLLFANLARNAVIHNRSEMAKIKISLGQGPGTVIMFEDNGEGIASESWNQVFTEYHRARGNGVVKPRGAGLGLTICQRIMQAHAGAISIHSSGPEGTVFKLEFPEVT